MSNITGFKRAKIRKTKLTNLDKLIKQQNNASQEIKASAEVADSILDWDLINKLQFSFNLTEVHYKPTKDNIRTICNKIEAQRLVIEPTCITIVDSVVNFYKDDHEYFIIDGKKVSLDDLKHKLLETILEDK